MTNVKFLTYIDEDGDIDTYAIFPDHPATNSQMIEGYAHIGMHTSIGWGYVEDSREATAEEYTPLLKELQGIYNDLQVLNTSEVS